jgi:hypothetical protein
MELFEDININYPVSGAVESKPEYFPNAMEVRKMANAVCDAKRLDLTVKIRKQIYDLILKSANSGNYSVEISSNGETSNLFKLIGQSNIIDELKQQGFNTNYADLSAYGDNRVFIIKWDKEY